MKYSNYIKIMRPKHYIKNLLVFLPLVFSGLFFTRHYLAKAILSFVAFCLVASAVYIINDLRDKELDKLHEIKKIRLISSGVVGTSEAIIECCILLALAATVQYFANPSLTSYGLLFAYISINVLYSFGFKNIPIIDIFILSLGFLIRVFYGGNSVGIIVSKWLYLAVLAFSFYLGLGKRRNEIKTIGIHTRKLTNFIVKNS